MACGDNDKMKRCFQSTAHVGDWMFGLHVGWYECLHVGLIRNEDHLSFGLREGFGVHILPMPLKALIVKHWNLRACNKKGHVWVGMPYATPDGDIVVVECEMCGAEFERLVRDGKIQG